MALRSATLGGKSVSQSHRLRNVIPQFRLLSPDADARNRTIHQFSDAELTAILRRRIGVVPVESDEERPEDAALN